MRVASFFSGAGGLDLGFENAGFEIGKDLYLAHCPERVLPGKILEELVHNDRIIGGVTPECSVKASEVYGQFVEGYLMLTEAKNKIIWTSMWVIMIVSMISLFSGITIVAFLVPEGIAQTLTLLSLCVIFLLPCFYALKLEISVGCYKCKNCGQEIIPTYSEALWAMHRGTTRYLKCPKCNKRTWCKKIIKK